MAFVLFAILSSRKPTGFCPNSCKFHVSLVFHVRIVYSCGFSSSLYIAGVSRLERTQLVIRQVSLGFHIEVGYQGVFIRYCWGFGFGSHAAGVSMGIVGVSHPSGVTSDT